MPEIRSTNFRLRKFLIPALAVCNLLPSCQQQQTEEVRPEFGRYYEQYQVQGTFVLFDPQKNRYTLYNPEQRNTPCTPASTFKICNSLIGLETGVIRDEHFVIPWDSTVRSNPAWNRNHDLQSAFRNSAVWYYQELARRVGPEKMKYWLDKAEYGNADTSGGVDLFWLKGGLRITPEQQIGFLRKLHDNKLPFSQRSMDIVKKIMVLKDTMGCVIRAKTGWGSDGSDVGWFVGYAETKGKVYYFANCIRSSDPDNPNFLKARSEIVYSILRELNIM